MARYPDGEARAWALAELAGCCGCVMPTFTSDVRSLNEVAIRHDVRQEKALGMRAVLVVAEGGTTVEEFNRFTDVVVEEAGTDLVVVVQASQPTWAEMVATVVHGAAAGAELVLPSYPLTYHPRTLDELYCDTRAFIEQCPIGVMLFAMDQWNFSRLHPAAFPLQLLERLVRDCPNLAAIKNEIGLPYAGGLVEVFERFAGRVLVTDPMEYNAPLWVRHYGMRFMGTSNYEAMGASVPTMLRLLSEPGTWDEGMALYWEMSPVRRANSVVVSPIVGATSLVPRVMWRYQGWLLGCNGGPLRSPQQRINAAQMAQLRAAASAAGLAVTPDPDELFWVGRNPR